MEGKPLSVKAIQPRALATRRVILAAAGDQFSVHGYSGTSLDMIVTGADVSKGAFAHHFARKEHTAEAVMAEPWVWLRDLPASDSPLAGLTALCAGLVDAMDTDPLVRGSVRLALERSAPAAGTDYERFQTTAVQLLTDAAAQGELALPLPAATEVTLSAVAGILVRHATRQARLDALTALWAALGALPHR